MKKLFVLCSMLLCTISSSAQYTVFQPSNTPSQPYSPSPGYGIPFATYEPVQGYQQQQVKPRMQQVTMRGYYKKGGDWCYAPIRVGFVEDKVILLSIKTQYGWQNCESNAKDVGAFDSEEIRDNFNFKAYTMIRGMVYF